jgi:hypothetical protein
MNTFPQGYETRHTVSDTVDSLVERGAVEVAKPFRVARLDQGEVIFSGERLLVTPNNLVQKQYEQVLGEAGVRHLQENPDLTTADVAVLDIPRDARTIAQVIRSKQPQGGRILEGVFRQLGSSVEQIATRTGHVPSGDALAVDRVLIMRAEQDVALVPPVEFHDYEPGISEQAVSQGMHDQLFPEYERFGAAALEQAFNQGLQRK